MRRISVCALAALLGGSLAMVPVCTDRTYAVSVYADSVYQELEGSHGRKIYVCVPEDYDPDREYPSVYLMPKDGYSAWQYRSDGAGEEIRKLERDGAIMDMVAVFPELTGDEDPWTQIEDTVSLVEENYSVSSDSSMRGVLGTGTGAYLAFLLGYSDREGNLQKEPQLFSAIGSHDGDFTSESNRYLEQYGSICSLLEDEVDAPYKAQSEWVANYYTYLDMNSDSMAASSDGGSYDIASLFRNDSLTASHSASAWDYSVFEYSARTSAHYGTYVDNLSRSLNRFSAHFMSEQSDGAVEEAAAGTYGGNETESGADSAGVSSADEAEIASMSSDEDETESVTSGDETESATSGEETEASVILGEDRMIDLEGDWYFNLAAGSDGIDALEKADWTSWDVVRPGLDWWTEDFASCLNGNPYYAGYAWYVRSFEVPEEFDTTGLQIDAGMIDEADEIYINSVRVGSTGIDKEGGAYDRSNPWDVERIYAIPDDLLVPGDNTIAVRMCNGSGAGGWYSGPIRIETVKEKEDPAESGQRFYAASFASKALRDQEIEYRVYLPEGYYESALRYPVVYMLHGYGSTGKSFEIAGVPEILDEGIASGQIPPCIVIFPNDGHSQKASWWTGPYASMLNEDLIAEVDSTLRTVPERDYRFIAGESMGGGGAWLNAIDHPELYAGIFDIYGALNYSGSMVKLLRMDAQQLQEYKIFMICGNHDMYTFDIEHMMVEKYLDKLKIPHVFEIDNGEHSSSFYLPYVKEGFAYLLSGALPVEEGK